MHSSAKAYCGDIVAGGSCAMRSLWTTGLTAVNVAWRRYFGGASMAAIERNSDESDSVRDFAWHRTHRARHGGQLIDVVMLAGWAALVGWVLLRH
jgi:hypothetical protein